MADLSEITAGWTCALCGTDEIIYKGTLFGRHLNDPETRVVMCGPCAVNQPAFVTYLKERYPELVRS